MESIPGEIVAAEHIFHNGQCARHHNHKSYHNHNCMSKEVNDANSNHNGHGHVHSHIHHKHSSSRKKAESVLSTDSDLRFTRRKLGDNQKCGCAVFAGFLVALLLTSILVYAGCKY